MPDLTNETFYHCATAENWQTEVPSSTGNGSYTVRWDNHSHLNTHQHQYDYSCTCWAYKKGKGKPCKHIQQVLESNQHCKWSQFIHGGEVGRKNGQAVCPKCGEEAIAQLWGV
jgi:hypothetical protein